MHHAWTSYFWCCKTSASTNILFRQYTCICYKLYKIFHRKRSKKLCLFFIFDGCSIVFLSLHVTIVHNTRDAFKEIVNVHLRTLMSNFLNCFYCLISFVGDFIIRLILVLEVTNKVFEEINNKTFLSTDLTDIIKFSNFYRILIWYFTFVK